MNRHDIDHEASVADRREPSGHPASHVPRTPNHEPAAADDLGFDLPRAVKVSKTRVIGAFLGIALVLGAAFLVAWIPKHRAKTELAASTQSAETAKLKVTVVTPKAKSSDRSLALPGSVQPLEETTVYPRASGYVRKWNVDIGDKVKEGAILAEIDTPELDQQIDQARAQLVQVEANLVQAKANRDFSNTNLQRYKELAPKGVASQQELDKQQAQSLVDDANVKVAQAAIEAQQANVRRLTQLKSFSHVVTPFAGTVNARMIERGALVSPTTPLFKVSATDPVRVFVQIPQDIAPSVRENVPASITVREYGNRKFDGKVSRAAGALDPASRTMTTEIRIPNPGGELLAGMYAQASLTLPNPHRVYEIPPTAVLNDAQGLRVAVVGEGEKIHFVPVVVERDTGTTVEISSGLTGNERIVKLASAETYEGRPVEVAAP